MIQVLGTGLSGLVGTRVTELLSDEFEFTDLSYDSGVDITNSDQVMRLFDQSPADTVLHMAAKTDVDACEDDKILQEEGGAWMINVFGTQNIVDAAKKTGKRVIYISTDFVFNGTQQIYTEDDEPDPINWYGVTKYEGEKLVLEGDRNNIVARLSYPYRSYFPTRKDFVRKILELARDGAQLSALTDHVFTPTFIDDIAAGLRVLLSKDIWGVFHLVGGNSLTPFEATDKILSTFDLRNKIVPVLRKDFFRDRAFRPFHLTLKNDKISGFAVKMLTFDDGLIEIKRQMEKAGN